MNFEKRRDEDVNLLLLNSFPLEFFNLVHLPGTSSKKNRRPTASVSLSSVDELEGLARFCEEDCPEVLQSKNHNMHVHRFNCACSRWRIIKTLEPQRQLSQISFRPLATSIKMNVRED